MEAKNQARFRRHYKKDYIMKIVKRKENIFVETYLWYLFINQPCLFRQSR